MQLQLCDKSVQTCLTYHCFAETVWSALLDWHSWLIGCGSHEGWFLLLFFLWVCSHAFPWSRLLCALTQFPVMHVPLCCNFILSVLALASHMKQRTVHSVCVTLLNYLFMNFAVLVMFVLFAGCISVALNWYCRSSGCHYSKIFFHEIM